MNINYGELCVFTVAVVRMDGRDHCSRPCPGRVQITLLQHVTATLGNIHVGTECWCEDFNSY